MKTKKNGTVRLAGPLMAAVLTMGAGCGSESDKPKSGQANSSAASQKESALPADLFLDQKPEEKPASVSEIKKSAKEGDSVVMKVVVGGREKPFVSNRAIMTVVSADLENQCTEPGDSCKTPWDYCCAAPKALKENMATVQFVDGDGKPLKIDLDSVKKIKPLSVLTVVGKVGPRPDPEALVVTASGLYLEPQKQ
ncbi:MAG: hypothetical protein R3236_04985 [Phycisphaeraceae bacterium]|nr:hypothetical protein [Phycisphaeraceae bacterium]